MRLRLSPRENVFYELFSASAANILDGAQLLQKLVNAPVHQREDLHRQLRDAEHRGDDRTHSIMREVNSTFVTPLDREDIRALAHELDDLVDDAEEAGKRLSLYRLAEPIEPARLLASIVHEQAKVIAEAMPLLANVGKHGEEIRRHVVEIHRLENEADDVLSQALATLYDGVTEIPTLVTRMRWGELCGLLEDATDRAEDVADVLESIYLKNG